MLSLKLIDLIGLCDQRRSTLDRPRKLNWFDLRM